MMGLLQKSPYTVDIVVFAWWWSGDEMKSERNIVVRINSSSSCEDLVDDDGWDVRSRGKLKMELCHHSKGNWVWPRNLARILWILLGHWKIGPNGWRMARIDVYSPRDSREVREASLSGPCLACCVDSLVAIAHQFMQLATSKDQRLNVDGVMVTWHLMLWPNINRHLLLFSASCLRCKVATKEQLQEDLSPLLKASPLSAGWLGPMAESHWGGWPMDGPILARNRRGEASRWMAHVQEIHVWGQDWLEMGQSHDPARCCAVWPGQAKLAGNCGQSVFLALWAKYEVSWCAELIRDLYAQVSSQGVWWVSRIQHYFHRIAQQYQHLLLLHIRRLSHWNIDEIGENIVHNTISSSIVGMMRNPGILLCWLALSWI